MSGPSEYEYGSISAGANGYGRPALAISRTAYQIAPADVPEVTRGIARALYEAAGLTAPVIADGPAHLPTMYASVQIGPARVHRSMVGGLPVGLECDSPLSAATARELGATLIAEADEADQAAAKAADARPDPELVKRIAGAMPFGEDSLQVDGFANLAEAAARAAAAYYAEKTGGT